MEWLCEAGGCDAATRHKDWLAYPQRLLAGDEPLAEFERVKQVAPVWKHEYFEDGDAWVEGALAGVDDDEARRVARERACA